MPAHREPRATVLTSQDRKFDTLRRGAAQRCAHLAVDVPTRRVGVQTTERDGLSDLGATTYAARLQWLPST